MQFLAKRNPFRRTEKGTADAVPWIFYGMISRYCMITAMPPVLQLGYVGCLRSFCTFNDIELYLCGHICGAMSPESWVIA